MAVDAVSGSALRTAVQGIQQGERRIAESAHEIANASVGNPDGQAAVTDSLVGLKTATQDIQASAKVIETVDETIGSLLDIKA